MIRNCPRCSVPMIENCDIETVECHKLKALVKKEGKILRTGLGVLKASVCPRCGEVSIYLEDTEKLKDIDLSV